MGHISERADGFVRRLTGRRPAPPEAQQDQREVENVAQRLLRRRREVLRIQRGLSGGKGDGD